MCPSRTQIIVPNAYDVRRFVHQKYICCMNLCLFEDPSSFLFPLTHCRAAFDLSCGIFTAYDRCRWLFPQAAFSCIARDVLAEHLRERLEIPVNEYGASVYINGCALLTKQIAARIQADTGECLYVSGTDLIAARITDPALAQRCISAVVGNGGASTFVSGIPVVELSCVILKHPWDLIAQNRTMLFHDAACFFESENSNCTDFPGVHVSSPENIFIGRNVRISPGVVLDADDGPVIIADDAVILPNAVIIGPAYVGVGSRIKTAAKLYQGSSIGPFCKVGGELEDSIFHSYSNKQHEGFVGHSYFAPWTNLGADTNTSDLKNNYSEIRVTLEGKEYRTGRMFIGTIMADHSKCGINTMFNTGTTVGVGCNIYGADFPPKYIPSFSWGGAGGLVEHDFDRFLLTAETVMERRGVSLRTAERTVYRSAFDATASQRVYKTETMSH
jgi:UDP-N-acetylglucosamine diphosphorylase / glucose-1-phosphate thymidylyltransferase / UDP-N-acetylgalactosamine diphosphorylase / glucosamine-1-phosphate N-acetyltransferase / galactosamine-1-phosphate N-acetyltransferase